MKRPFVFAFLVIAFALRASTPAQDLGQGLIYHRVHQLPADLPTAETVRRQPCVLDLRYVQAAAGEAMALEAWVKFRATAHTPIIILANAETTPALLAPFAARRASAGVIVVGIAGPGFAPDVAVRGSRNEERRAYDAHDAGTALDSLLNDTPDKPRNDEASLAGNHAADAQAESESPVSGKGSKPSSANTPTIDVVLQRAVHLHRTLVALKKL
jgi:hypothetical protein